MQQQLTTLTAQFPALGLVGLGQDTWCAVLCSWDALGALASCGCCGSCCLWQVCVLLILPRRPLPVAYLHLPDMPAACHCLLVLLAHRRHVPLPGLPVTPGRNQLLLCNNRLLSWYRCLVACDANPATSANRN